MLSVSKFFLAIRNGSLGTQISQFTSDDFTPFLPLIVHRFLLENNDSNDVNQMFEPQQLVNFLNKTILLFSRMKFELDLLDAQLEIT